MAAESHVDRSITDPGAFVRTNVIGTQTMLDAARERYDGLTGADRETFRFLHVSRRGLRLPAAGRFFTEESRYDPRSPYSASKAASDHLARAWHETYGLPVLVTNCSNNYGPRHFPEKLIPLMILNALEGRSLPVYGDGLNERDWIHVEDHAKGLVAVLERGRIGETYLLGGRAVRNNLAVVKGLCAAFDRLRPEAGPHERLITFVADRPGHDRRYAIDCTKAEAELGWAPQKTFEAAWKRRWRGTSPTKRGGARSARAAIRASASGSPADGHLVLGGAARSAPSFRPMPGPTACGSTLPPAMPSTSPSRPRSRPPSTGGPTRRSSHRRLHGGGQGRVRRGRRVAPERARPGDPRGSDEGAGHPPRPRLDRLRLRGHQAGGRLRSRRADRSAQRLRASKAAGEIAVRTGNPRHAILRTAWVVSPHRGNFVKTMLRLAAERDRLTVVDDQHGCPTSATDLAAALATVALRMAVDPAAPTGTFHCVNDGSTTWCGFARAIVAGGAKRGGRAGAGGGHPDLRLPDAGPAPVQSRLSTDSLREAYGILPRPWQDALDDILDRLAGPVRA